MRRIWITALTASLAFVPALVDAQQPGPRGPRPHPELAGNPAARVLALPTVFELTAAQVRQLEQIRDRAAAQNQPLIAQLQSLRPERPAAGQRGQMTPEQMQARREQMQARREQMQGQRQQSQAQREQMRAQMGERRAQMQQRREQLQPILTQLRQNAENTRREVEGVLNSEQVAKLRELQAHRPGGERGPLGRGAGGQRAPRPVR